MTSNTMSGNTLLRFTGAASLVCGLITLPFWLLHPVAGDPHAPRDAAYWAAVQSARYMATNAMFIAILVLCLLALIGVAVRMSRRTGAPTLLMAVLAFTGTAMFVGAGCYQAFVLPALAADPATRSLLADTGPLLGGPMGAAFAVGGMLFAIGYVGLGLSILRSGAFPRAIGLMLVLSSWILGLSPLMPLAPRAIGTMTWAVAHVWIGLCLLRGRIDG